MEFRVLKYFLAAAQEGSITGAAQLLHVTQPTLSRQLMELEEELGAKLLIRGKRGSGISLTEQGRLLRQRAEEIVQLAQKTQTELSVGSGSISGDVYIGSGETQAMNLLAKAAYTVRQEHPGVCFHLFSGNADDVKDRLDKGLLDFGVLIEPAVIDKYDFQSLPGTDTWGLLMRCDSPLALKNVITPGDLSGIPLLVSRQTMVQGSFSHWYGSGFDRLDIVATYNLIYNASLMVANGCGHALCLDGLVDTREGSSLCFRPLSPGLESHLNIVWKKHQVFSKAADVFLSRLRQLI